MADSTLGYRLMHAGIGVWFGLVAGVIIWLSFFRTTHIDVALYCIGSCMVMFALIGLAAPRSLVDTFARTLKFGPWS